MAIEFEDKCAMPKGTFRVRATKAGGWNGDCPIPIDEIGKWEAQSSGLKEGENPVPVRVRVDLCNWYQIRSISREDVEAMYKGDINLIKTKLVEPHNNDTELGWNDIEVYDVSINGKVTGP